MKHEIHPKYGAVSIRCACGNVIDTKSTLQGNIQVDVCSACHPFFTGKQKLMDSAGRIDRLKNKFGDKIALGSQAKPKSKGPALPKLPKLPSKKENPLKALKEKKDAQAAPKTPENK